jgi:hypothetical protein
MAQVDISQSSLEVWYREPKIYIPQASLEAWYLPPPQVTVTQVSLEAWYLPPDTSAFGQITTGALDLRFTTPNQDAPAWSTFRVRTNILYDPEDTYGYVSITISGGALYLHFHRLDGGADLASTKLLDVSQYAYAHDWRIYWHNNFISVYIDKEWVYTMMAEEITYPDSPIVDFYCDQSKSITDITLVELHDWRQAVYTEADVNGLSLISSIIQERPIEMYVDSNGKLRFHYNIDPSAISFGGFIRSMDEIKAIRDAGGSDFIVYYKDVVTIVDLDFLEDFGFMTRVLRLSNLDTGADFAAKIISKRTRERQTVNRIRARADYRIEPGDVISISITESGTGRVTSANLFCEAVSIQLRAGEITQVIHARLHEGP